MHGCIAEDPSKSSYLIEVNEMKFNNEEQPQYYIVDWRRESKPFSLCLKGKQN